MLKALAISLLFTAAACGKRPKEGSSIGLPPGHSLYASEEGAEGGVATDGSFFTSEDTDLEQHLNQLTACIKRQEAFQVLITALHSHTFSHPSLASAAPLSTLDISKGSQDSAPQGLLVGALSHIKKVWASRAALAGQVKVLEQWVQERGAQKHSSPSLVDTDSSDGIGQLHVDKDGPTVPTQESVDFLLTLLEDALEKERAVEITLRDTILNSQNNGNGAASPKDKRGSSKSSSADSPETAEKPTLIIHVKGLRNNKGNVVFALFKGSKGFPNDGSQAVTAGEFQVQGLDVITVKNLSPGTYAATLFHDENKNGKLDTQFKIPTEGFGFTGNPRIKMGSPSFEECSFEVPESGVVQMDVKMIYLFN